MARLAKQAENPDSPNDVENATYQLAMATIVRRYLISMRTAAEAGMNRKKGLSLVTSNRPRTT